LIDDLFAGLQSASRRATDDLIQKITTFGFADDVAIIAMDAVSVQQLIEVAELYSLEHF
jgi:hypothetical protein